MADDEPLSTDPNAAEPLSTDPSAAVIRVPMNRVLVNGRPVDVPARTWGDTAEDVAKGVAKGVGNTVYGLGKLVHDYTPIGRISDAIQLGAFEPQNKPPELTPTNAAQKTGYYGEQLGEFFLPTAEAGALAKVPGLTQVPGLVQRAVTGAQAAGLTAAQTGGDLGTAGVSGALSAALPGAGTVQTAAGALERSAQQTMANSLRATKEWAKAESERLAPQMLERGVGGSIPQLRTLATTMAAKIGANLGDAYKAAAAAGQTVPGDVVRGNIQLASDALHTTAATGSRLAIPGYEDAIAKLDQLDSFVSQLGQDIPVDKAAAIKQAWDQIVAKAGLYSNNATAPASEKAAAWSFREAADAFRDLLNTNPTIENLNKEFSFWGPLRDVVNATKLRKVGQTGGLIRAGAATTGAAVGALTGDDYSSRGLNAILGGMAASQFTRLMQSPWWMSKASAPFKQAVANALASGRAETIAGAVRTAITAAPSYVRQQFAP